MKTKLKLKKQTVEVLQYENPYGGTGPMLPPTDIDTTFGSSCPTAKCVSHTCFTKGGFDCLVVLTDRTCGNTCMYQISDANGPCFLELAEAEAQHTITC